ncbi:MAG: thioredoxin [Anaerolineae bacterium]|nr:thioredoxin [Anaerolineae bacterium]
MKTTAKNAAEKLLIVKVDAADNPSLTPGITALRDGKEIARTPDLSAAALQNYADFLLGKTAELKKETPAKTTKPIVITDSTFAEQVLTSEKPVLVDFWATWCPPCLMIAPTLEKLAGEFAGKATIAKLDVDQNPQTAQVFQVRSIPTLIVFKNGQMVDRAVGALPEPALRNLIQKHL